MIKDEWVTPGSYTPRLGTQEAIRITLILGNYPLREPTPRLWRRLSGEAE